MDRLDHSWFIQINNTASTITIRTYKIDGVEIEQFDENPARKWLKVKAYMATMPCHSRLITIEGYMFTMVEDEYHGVDATGRSIQPNYW